MFFVLGYGTFDFFWDMTFLRKKKNNKNKHKIIAELLFSCMVSNFPWETSHPDPKAPKIYENPLRNFDAPN